MIIQPLRKAPKGEGGRLVDFVMKRYGEGERVLNAFFSCHSLFLFTSGKVT